MPLTQTRDARNILDNPAYREVESELDDEIARTRWLERRLAKRLARFVPARNTPRSA